MIIDLPDILPDLDDIIVTQLGGLRSAKGVALAEAGSDLCIALRTTAVASLLVELDIDRFHHSLIRSALVRIHVLERTPPDVQRTTRFCSASRSSSFFDALAAGRFDLASTIATLSPRQWTPRFEYEDDFLYARFMYDLVAMGPQAEHLPALLDRFEDVLEGAPSDQLDLCRLFLDPDRGGFERTFNSMVSARSEWVEFQFRSIGRDELSFAGEQHIWIEGLAILRLAESRGIAVKPEYRFCPREARMPMEAPFTDIEFPVTSELDDDGDAE